MDKSPLHHRVTEKEQQTGNPFTSTRAPTVNFRFPTLPCMHVLEDEGPAEYTPEIEPGPGGWGVQGIG